MFVTEKEGLTWWYSGQLLQSGDLVVLCLNLFSLSPPKPVSFFFPKCDSPLFQVVVLILDFEFSMPNANSTA